MEVLRQELSEKRERLEAAVGEVEEAEAHKRWLQGYIAALKWLQKQPSIMAMTVPSEEILR